ncbi:mitochondrial intermediate peptidase [Polychaeton citri CBS 116435]|uniref:Mitochondrial intermediate peptidase n=1 Tax=Polychaeton citri CBS 116435 TaxID=1314669 RepID=A0A9P4Q217_9PEZI|nr:mitochondrial intermediate peptidase [Polychaeton citri CBS 116435]
MFKRAITGQAWTCPQCLRQQQRLQRLALRSLVTSTASKGATTAAATAQVQPDNFVHPANKTTANSRHDDRTLRQIFDSQDFWKDFSSATRHQYNGQNAGLLQNRYLMEPEGFIHFTQITLQKCQRIVSTVLAYSSIEDLKRSARDMDRLSDLLCRVIDLSDFIRSVHPDRRVQMAATQAYATMFEYMNVLNTTPGLNEQLIRAINTPEVWQSWSEEEKVVATMLHKDFAKSAIDMEDEDRQAFVDVSNDISRVGPDFVENMQAETPLLSFKSPALMGMNPLLVKRLSQWGTVNLPTVGEPAINALRTVEDADTRRDIYMANRTSATSNIERLEEMLRKRAELAKLAGYESFAHMTLTDKMAKTPEAVNSFLDALSLDNKPKAKDELEELLDIKRGDAHPGNFPDGINAWDRDYYTARLLANLRSRSRSPDFLSAYFSLGTVFQGLSRLFHNLYGLRLVPRETLPGETWNSDVRRLDVLDDNEGHIAVIYCDLFERAGKSPNPAHFTLRCSRRISDEEMQEAAVISQQNPQLFPTPESAVNDGLAVNSNPRDGGRLYQLPTIALICDFALPPPSRSTPGQRPTLLTFRELTTLFHEMGHAVHSICGRTALQNVSGTRCPTDFAELPSVLMENFAAAPEVLALFARHWETGQPLDPSRVQERVDIDKRTAGSEVEGQILLSKLDQEYHSAIPLSWSAGSSNLASDLQSTQLYHSIWQRYSTIPEPAGTSWQGFFGHLFGYGATYYSYLFDRAIAGKIWRDVFQRTSLGAVDPEQGRLFREEVLRHGGGRDGWISVAGALRDREGVLSEGGKGAMEMVGRWGVHN